MVNNSVQQARTLEAATAGAGVQAIACGSVMTLPQSHAASLHPPTCKPKDPYLLPLDIALDHDGKVITADQICNCAARSR
jgi:hypothetical protein